MEPHEGLPGTEPAASRPAGPGHGHATAGVETSAVQPPDAGRAARLTVGLLALTAVVLIGAAVLTGPGLLGAGEGDVAGEGGVAAAPPAGPVGPATSPEVPGAAATTTTPATLPSATPYLVWPTPTPPPSRTPPPDVPVVDRGQSPLVRSGIVLVGPASASDDWPSLVADAGGTLWAVGSAGLLRYEPATARRAVWTVEDDAAFGGLNSMLLVAARDGGVWLADGTPAIRRFDGQRFLDVLEAPGQVTALAEDRDGTLWVGASTGLYRRDDGTWKAMAYASEKTTVSSLMADSRGDIWVGWLAYPTPPGAGWITRWDGSRWDRFDGADAVPLGSPVQSIGEAPDGSVWAGTAGGLARYDGTTWTTVDQPLGSVASIAWDGDGAAWIASGDPGDGAVRVVHDAPAGWTVYGPEQGLPGANESWTIAALVVPTPHGVFVGTGAGIRTLTDGRWARVGPAAPPTSGAPTWAGTLLAVSRDEAWAVDDRGIWHAADGAWTIVPGPAGIDVPPGEPRDLLLDRDGRLWAATSAGVLVLEDGSWTEADRRPAAALALGPDGRVWAAGEDPAMGPQHVRAFRRLGGSWGAEPLPATDLVAWARSLAVDRDGTVWLGSFGSWGIRPGLLRYTPARGWEKVPVRGATAETTIWDIATAPDGTAWAVGSDVVPEGTATTDEPATPPRWWIARLDADPVAVPGESTRWPPYGIAVLPGGVPVVPAGTVGGGLAAWDGERWTHRLGGLSFDQVSVTPDGTIWVTGRGGVWILP